MQTIEIITIIFLSLAAIYSAFMIIVTKLSDMLLDDLKKIEEENNKPLIIGDDVQRLLEMD